LKTTGREFVVNPPSPLGKNVPNSSREILPFGDISPRVGGGTGDPRKFPARDLLPWAN